MARWCASAIVLRTLASLALTAAAALMPASAQAAPVDEKIALLRSRPTGMDEAEWKKKRREVAAELGDIRSKEATDALIEIVETERYDAVLSIAIQGLGKQGDVRAIEPLQKIHADRSIDTFVREEARAAIVALGGTPRDDARLVGGATTGGSVGEAVLEGPQLGTMGEASVAEDAGADPTKDDKPLPKNLRARERSFGFAVASLDLDVNTLASQQPVLADAGLGAYALYVDERHRWGWRVDSLLSARVANGDVTSLPAMPGGDNGDTLLFHQDLEAAGDVHVYFGKTDFHAFVGLGFSERVTTIRVEDTGNLGGNESNLSGTRFALDIVPAAGLGWGRLLNGGSDLMVDAIVNALEQENILSRPLDDDARRAIRDAVYRRSNAFSAWPRLQAALAVLETRGYLARRPGPRLVHRIRSIVEDPSYFDRPKGILARAGFLYGVPIVQDDFFRREGDATGAPFVRFDAGFQIDRERQILADTRFWYDVVGNRGFTTDSGVRYTRFIHTKWHDYAGQWSAGVRGGASGRTFPDLEMNDISPRIGYRAIAMAGYAYGFQRGSEISVAANAGVDSGAFVLGAGVGVRIGIARGSVLNAPATASTGRAGPPKAGAAGAGTARSPR
jgi:hypothetical protein